MFSEADDAFSPFSVCNIDGTALPGKQASWSFRVAKLLSSVRYHGYCRERRSEDVGMRQSEQRCSSTERAARTDKTVVDRCACVRACAQGNKKEKEKGKSKNKVEEVSRMEWVTT